MDFKSLITEIRANAGEPKRRFDDDHKVNMDWLKSLNDPILGKQARDSERLFSDGEIVWAALVQANVDLFDWGLENQPGLVLYSKDSRIDPYPHMLMEVAKELYAIKGEASNDPEIQLLSDAIEDELDRPVNLKIPLNLTYDIPCLMTVIEFERTHLPGGRLQGKLMPILTHPITPSVMVLPHWYWAESFNKFVDAAKE